MVIQENSQTSLDLLHSGEGWIAIHKPTGMSVHNDAQSKTDAISLVAEWLKVSERAGRPLPVHRLDRETSGILIFALNPETAKKIQRAFEERRPKKTYLAVLKGSLKQEAGVWNAPLSDRAEGRKSPAGRKEDRIPCETRFRRLLTNGFLTEIEVDLGTGRQHQIRKHSSLAGHPIVGDLRYGDPKHAERIEKLFGVSRLLLHSYRLEFPDPQGGAPITIEAPRPPQFSQVFEAPRSGGGER